jgi:2-amino-4-hydroxy-6-hydroxymethyldihydropteridine diphosphokinase
MIPTPAETRVEEIVFLGLGSNLGDRLANIAAAIERLRPVLGSLRHASYYESRAQEDTRQADFLNTVATGRTGLPAHDLLDSLQEIESDLGRRRDPSRPKGPRTLDIDILLYGTRLIDDERLSVPHPRMTMRKFVLLPLLELAPTLIHPGGRPFTSYLDTLGTQGIYYFPVTRYSAG